MKRILLLPSFLFLLFTLCGFTGYGQIVQHTGNHAHQHIAPDITDLGNGREQTDLLFDPCPTTGVHVTYSELIVAYIDPNDGYVELTSANATAECYAHAYTLPTTYDDLGYYFYLEYSDNTYEMLTIDY